MGPLLAIIMCILMLVLKTVNSASSDTSNANVLNYGAIGDGKTDDTLAFEKAWSDTCNSEAATPIMIIPEGKSFFVQPLNFSGPCKSQDVYFQLSGQILAPNSRDEWKGGNDLLSFRSVNGLTVNGSGSIDGRGKGWWDVSCRYHPELQGCSGRAPTTLMFVACSNVEMKNIYLTNSPQTHILVWSSINVNLAYFNVTSPGDSPNTDGVHLQNATSVQIQNANIQSGDDCISIGDRTSHITISDIFCGPGHGISIGSLGSDGGEAKVEEISVERAHISGTTNGLRIKTYQIGKGSVQNVSYVNVTFDKVQNPIIIDQHYCFSPNGCQDLDTAVHINNVSYIGLSGTSSTEIAVNFNCSKPVPCTNIRLESIQLTAEDPKGDTVTSNCENAYGFSQGTVQPNSCLKSG